MFYYIYKMTDLFVTNFMEGKLKDLKASKNLLWDNEIYLDTTKSSESIISGQVNLFSKGISKVPFEIRIKSKFLFIKTNRQNLNIEAYEVLEDFLNKDEEYLDDYIPFEDKERKFICGDSEEKREIELKVLYDGDLLEENTEPNLLKKYCANKLKKGSILYEADIILDNNVEFSYYGKSFYIPNKKHVNNVVELFEKYMA